MQSRQFEEKQLSMKSFTYNFNQLPNDVSVHFDWKTEN